MIDVNEKHPAWRTALHAGALHVFRLRIVCPCCGTVWYMDVLDVPEQFEIPDRRKLGLATLCGSCEARRLTQFVVHGKGGWSAPFLTKSEIAQSWAKLMSVPKGDWIRVEPWCGTEADTRCPWDGFTALRNDRADLFRACTTREREGRSVNVTGMTAELLSASGLGWKIPQAPIGQPDADAW